MKKAPINCSEQDCVSRATCKGLCSKHYLRAYHRSKRPLRPKLPCKFEDCSKLGTKTTPYCTDHFKRAKELGLWGDAPPCPASDCDRRVVTRGMCSIHSQREYNKTNGDKDKAYRAYVKEHHPERHKARNEAKLKRQRDTQYDRSPRRREYKKRYCRENLEAFAARTATRRAKKLQATPAWANLDKIREIYLNCPAGYEVDHIVPLNSPVVCGLHVEHNLQYLTQEENRRKSNKLNVDQEG